MDVSGPGLQIICKVTLFKTAWYWHIYRYIDQQNILDSPEINPYTYGQSMTKGQEYTMEKRPCLQ